MSAGLPRAATVSAHFASVAISSSLSEGSLWNCWMPMFFSTYHGCMTPALGPMAVLATALQDWRDVLRERDLIWHGTRRGVQRVRCAQPHGCGQQQAQPQGEFPGSRHSTFHREHPFT